ncbi:MAG: ABC transporter ATP-binding protein, partial [Lachnospiraceae bacterium]|nr:ABC transporter ATP-binding protein [Lachnospiraceae bacterium]
KENDLKNWEEKIQTLETAIHAIEEKMSQPEYACSSLKLTELTKEQASLQEQLDAQYELWEELAED